MEGDTMNDKPIIVSAIIGGIDTPKIIPAQSVPFDEWHITEPPAGIAGNDRTQALYYKCNLHTILPERSTIIWLDGKIQVTSPDFVKQIVEALYNSQHGLCILKHGERKCIYEEIDYIEKEMRRGSRYLKTRYADKPIRRQVEAYRYFGYGKNNGLNDCSIMAINNNDYTEPVYRDWWQDVYECNGFDQTAIQFHAWRHGVKITDLVFSPYSFKLVSHNLIK